MKANSDKSKQSNKATRRVLAGVLCGASVLSLVLSLVMPPISQAIANDAEAAPTEEAVADKNTLDEEAGAGNSTGKDAENRISDDGEGGEGEDAVTEGQPSDDTKVEGDTQSADDGQSVDKVATVANEGEVSGLQRDDDGYTLLTSDKDLSAYLNAPTKPDKLRLKNDISSSSPITIEQDTTIDLAGHKLYYSNGNSNKDDRNSVCTFITIKSGFTLNVEGTAVDSPTEAASGDPGRPATMQFDGESVPQSLTYYVTESTPNSLGTSEETYQHTVTNFGAIVACKAGFVNQVISVQERGTLNLKGGMITTPRNLGYDGHVIFSRGTVNISGGYVTNGNGGGWGGGLCITGNNAKLEMTGGVIAGNKAGSGGGVYADNGAKLNFSGGVISGNATYDDVYNEGRRPDNGYGGGVFTKGVNVNISGSANITNNRVNSYINDSNIYNKGLLGGGGIASVDGGTLTMEGGSVTANYSKETGGGIYAGFWDKKIQFTMTGGTIAGNESLNGEGGGLRIAGGNSPGMQAKIEASPNSKIYITNNKTMTGVDCESGGKRGGDWGGGGVFIQKGGRLNIFKTLITNNRAGGWGGGVGACPTGETIVSHSNGAAIYDNTDNVDQDGNKLDEYHYSAGGDNKNEDHNEKDYVTPLFQGSGHKDFFLVRNKDHADSTIAVVLGKMLGGGSADWKGTCDGKEITIDANGGAEAKWMFGLAANPSDAAKSYAQRDATTIISGNYSYTHGGGIMTNGDLVVGDVKGLDAYPNMKLHATKVLMSANEQPTSLEGHNYKFKLLRQNGTKEPFWKDGRTFDMGDCSVAGEATVKPDGSITFDSGKDYSSGQYVFYLVEEPVSGENEMDTRFDETIYKIEVTVDSSSYKTEYLMSIPIKYYKVTGVIVYKKGEKDSGFQELNSGSYSVDYSNDYTTATVNLGNSSNNPAFTNKIVPYTSTGSWTPKATKVVKGGEMKEFTLEFADNEDFNNAKTVNTKAGDKKSQTLSFVDKIEYTLDKLNKLESDSTGRGASNTFTYYVREQPPTAPFTNYKYDMSVYKITVNATDQSDRTIKCDVTYIKIVDAEGKEIPEDKREKKQYGEDSNVGQSLPTFTNTYSTTLPLSGMSGVTLTYLAGAAVLCAAAAWMHIRRKANAKGGERRE